MLTHIQPHQDYIALTPTQEPDWESFPAWTEQLCLWAGLGSNHDIDSGADRHMITLTFQHQRFDLHYENYSQSIWIEPQDSEASRQLDALARHLSGLTGQ